LNRKWIIPVIAAAFLCTACAFLPKEEQLPEAPVLRASEDDQYTQVAVLRGDVIAKEFVICKYQPAVEEVYRFALDDEIIKQAYVEVGDEVKVGDLLVELECTDLVRKVEAQQDTLDSLNLQITQTDEKLKLYYERCALLDEANAAVGGYSGQSDAADRTCLQLYEELEYLKKLLTVEQMAMDELQAELDLYQIRATMDGTVRSVVTVTEGMENRSTKMMNACIVSDLTSGNFAARVDKGLFELGDQVMVVYNDAEHEAEVVELIPSEKDEKVETVLFQLVVPDASLDTDTSGNVTVVYGERLDVLYLPTSAVHTRNNVSVVYYLDEDGIRSSKQVEIGLEASGMVEIVSGLEEGELVIK